MGAVGRFVHPMSFLQQLKEFLYWDSWVRRASQSEDLPQQHPIRPPEHTHTQWRQIRGQAALMACSSRRSERGSPDKPMTPVGEILIFDNVYCNQFKNQVDILIVWDSRSISVGINNSSLQPERRRVKTQPQQKEMEDRFSFVNRAERRYVITQTATSSASSFAHLFPKNTWMDGEATFLSEPVAQVYCCITPKWPNEGR